MGLNNARHFIIGGTEKAGTTSVFTYLSEHPSVCASSRKETDFFRDEANAVASCDTLARYHEYFERYGAGHEIAMEASPGYLGESATVAARVAALLPKARFLFILRDPTERFVSSFRFHQERFNVPAELSLGEYFEACRAHEAGAPVKPALGEWYLKVLNFGCYADRLQPYLEHFPREQLLIKYFDDLGADPKAFMTEVSDFLQISGDVWQDYEFHRQNVTFASRFGPLHKLALRTNDLLEPFLRRNPGIKRRLLGVYKSLNEAPLQEDAAAAAAKAALRDYYAQPNACLATLLGTRLPDSWSAS
ncbi:MAG: sulfotransferase [Pseudomonadota bacterium]